LALPKSGSKGLSKQLTLSLLKASSPLYSILLNYILQHSKKTTLILIFNNNPGFSIACSCCCTGDYERWYWKITRI